jgi:hypothetical protein
MVFPPGVVAREESAAQALKYHSSYSLQHLRESVE